MSYSATILGHTPSLYWRLNDSGATAADASGNSRTGNYNGSPAQLQGALVADGDADSVLFDATNDFCLSAALFNTSLCSVEIWFDYDGVTPSAGNFHFICGFNEGDGGGTGDKILLINDADELVFYAFDGSAKYAITTGVAVPTGINHLVGTCNGSNLKVYLNGVVGSNQPAASGTFNSFTNPNILVGGDTAAVGTAGRKAGRRAEFAVYNYALTQAEVEEHYEAGLTPPLVYEGAIGSVDTDTSGSITVGAGGVAEGSTILIGLVADFAGFTPTIVDDRGNTYSIDVNLTNYACIVRAYVETALQSGDTIDFDYGDFVRFAAEAHEFSGVKQVSPLDKTSASTTSFNTTHSSGLTATTTHPDELLFGCSQVQTGNAWTPSGSWIELEDSEYGVTSGRLVIQYQIVSATGAYQSNGTTGANCDSLSTIATYKDTAGPDVTADVTAKGFPRRGVASVV